MNRLASALQRHIDENAPRGFINPRPVTQAEVIRRLQSLFRKKMHPHDLALVVFEQWQDGRWNAIGAEELADYVYACDITQGKIYEHFVHLVIEMLLSTGARLQAARFERGAFR